MPVTEQSQQVSRTSQRTRTRIVESVVDMILAHGISGTTLANVAAHAGVSQGVLVFHFKTKEGLLAETLVRLFDEYRDAWMEATAAETPLERMLGLIRADFSASICTKRKLAVWFAFWGEAGAKPLYNRICAQAEEERASAMVEACRELASSVPISDPELLAHAIDACTDGLWLQMHIQGSDFPRAQALDASLSTLRLLLPSLADAIE